MLPGLAGIAGVQGILFTATYQASANSGTNGTSYTASAIAFGTASADRYIVVAASTEDGGAITSATIGGISATILVQRTSGSVTAALLIALVPTGTTGDVVVNFTGTSDHHGVAVWSVTGMPSATPLDTDSNTTGSGLTLTSQVGGLVFAATAYSDAATTTWSGATEVYDLALGSGQAQMSGASGNTSSGSVVVTPTPSAAPPQQAFIAVTF